VAFDRTLLPDPSLIQITQAEVNQPNPNGAGAATGRDALQLFEYLPSLICPARARLSVAQVAKCVRYVTRFALHLFELDDGF
jgi:hypothetical protein